MEFTEEEISVIRDALSYACNVCPSTSVDTCNKCRFSKLIDKLKKEGD